MAKPSLNQSISQVKRHFTWREPVRPFISSTFVDFEEERDHLVRRIFPQLNSLCHSRGTFFAPVDLRWGINEEQSQSGHVVSLCLDYINQCTPFFICLLGERYGSHRPNNAPPLAPSYRDLPDDAHWLDVNFLRAAANGHKWVLQDACQKASITELEIIQAAFLNDSKQCRFYFRDVRHIDEKFPDVPESERQENENIKPYLAEDQESEQKVAELKKGILARGLPVRFYTTAEELGTQVLSDWTTIINDVHPPLQRFLSNVDSELFQEWAAHEAYAETRRRVFIKTDNLKDLWEKLHQHGESAMEEEKAKDDGLSYAAALRKYRPPDCKSIFAVVGDRGCGKSAILANWVKSFSTLNRDTKVISYFVGSSSLSADITSFLRRATYELRGEFTGTETPSHQDADDLSDFHRICEAFIAAISLGPCVIVLDGIDELGPTLGLDIHQVKQLPWLPVELPKQCKIVISTIRSDLTYKCLCEREDTSINVVPLFDSIQDKGKVITDMLAVHCKHLDQSQVDLVVGSKLSDHPLYLSILANELRVGGTYRNLDKLLKQYVNADSFRDLWRHVIDRWTKDYGWDLDGRSSVSSNSQLDDMSGWVAEMLKLIACSRQGLSESELVGILSMMGYAGSLKVTTFDFAMLRSAAFDALFERPGGLMNFFHQHLREAVEFSLLGMCMVGYAGSLKVTTFDFAMLRSAAFDALFERPGGLMNFFHQHLREAVEFSLLGVIGGTGVDSPTSSVINFLPRSGQHHMKIKCHETLAAYFWKQPASMRRTEELTYQLEKCGDAQRLLDVVTEPDVFLTMCNDSSQKISLRLDLVRYWQCLVKEGHDPAVSYVNMVKKAETKEGEGYEENTTNGQLSAQAESTRNTSKVANQNQKKSAGEVSKNLPVIEETIVPQNGQVQFSERTSEATKSRKTSGKSCKEVASRVPVVEDIIVPQTEQLQFTQQPVKESSSKGLEMPANRDRKGQTVGESDTSGKSEGDSHDGDDDDTNDSDEYFDALEGDSDEEGSYYEHQPNERCKLAMLGMHAGKFLAEKSCFTEAEQLLTLAVDFMTKKFPLSTPEHVLLVQIQESLADLNYYQLNTVKALKCYNKALNTLENIAIGEKDFLYKQLMEAKGRLLNRIGLMRGRDNMLRKGDNMLRKGESILMQARDCMMRANSITGLATTQFNLGQLRIFKKDFEAGEACLREALQTRERWNGKSHPQVAEVLDNLAGVLSHPHNYDRCDKILAEAYYRRAVKIREQSFGGDHLLLATSLFHLGKLLRCSGNLQCKNEAVALLQRALDIRTTKLGPDHKLTHGVCDTLKQVQTQLKIRDYAAGVKKPDKRTKDNPRSGLTWHDHDLDKFQKRSRTRSANAKMFGQGKNSPRIGGRGDRNPSGRHSTRSYYGRSDVDHDWRAGAQSAPVPYDAEIDPAFQGEFDLSSQSVPGGYSDHENSQYWGRSSPDMRSGRSSPGPGARSGRSSPGPGARSGRSSPGPGARSGRSSPGPGARSGRSSPGPGAQSGRSSPGPGAMSGRSSPGPGARSGRILEGRPRSDMSWRKTVSHSASTRTGPSQYSESRPSTSFSRRSRGSQHSQASSAVSYAIHDEQCNIPGQFDLHPSNTRTIRSPHGHIHHLLGDPPCPRDTGSNLVHDAAWYHQPNRYPKNAYDRYPPRRHQVRPGNYFTSE